MVDVDDLIAGGDRSLRLLATPPVVVDLGVSGSTLYPLGGESYIHREEHCEQRDAADDPCLFLCDYVHMRHR